jgi:hypothetical protein
MDCEVLCMRVPTEWQELVVTDWCQETGEQYYDTEETISR